MAVEEKTAAPAQQSSEYDMVTLTSFLFKARSALLLALAVPERCGERQTVNRLERASRQPCRCLQALWSHTGNLEWQPQPVAPVARWLVCCSAQNAP